MTLGWKQGRKLSYATNNGVSFSYDYDGEGYRYRKKNGLTVYSYTTIDGVIYAETQTVGDVTTTLHYLFDESGTRYGFVLNGTDTYYYKFNLQGDVIGIYNESGSLVVIYKYDAWGKLLSTTGPGALTVGAANPFRYRGYYYDAETGFYFCTSRYYDPEVGRWINSDILISTHNKSLISNLMAYCFNNPANYVDFDGKDAILLLNTNGAGGFGHMGLLIQDKSGTWYHFFWGSQQGNSSDISTPTVCEVSELSGNFNLIELNEILKEKEIYNDPYEKMLYFSGDYTESLKYVQQYAGKYNLFTNNCMQLSLNALLRSDELNCSEKYIKQILRARNSVIPNFSFNILSKADLPNKSFVGDLSKYYYVKKVFTTIKSMTKRRIII